MPELRSVFLMRLSAELDAPLIIRDTPLGARRILRARGGSFVGPELQGDLLPGGGDWVLDRRDGAAELDIRFALRTSDGQLLLLRCRGIFDAAPQIRQRMQLGENIDAAEYYFRTAAVFECSSAKYDRLNRLVAIGVGRRTATGMVTDLFEVR